MLLGEYQHTLDAKGRVNFPVKLREKLGGEFIISKGIDGCLFVQSTEQFEKFLDSINALPLSQARNMQRYFSSSAASVEADKQGRILIPAALRGFAGLDKDVMIVGASIRAEIWDLNKWIKNNENLTDDVILEMMDGLGF